ncbi:MAG: DUF1080 domain-containing protein [Planctomycetaceae bacterium]|jgi:hypothetical protein|nr:DUF1080 domain-containing protein [Planctomycetaceae bacterium]
MKKLTVLFVLFAACLAATASAKDWRSGIEWTEPKVVRPGEKYGDPPADAVILFDGKDMSAWNKEWDVKDGVITVKPGSGSVETKQKFGSVQLHIEFATPAEVKGKDQGRGNSGVFFGPYEVQVLDSYGDNKTYFDGQCASIYKQRAPQVNVCRKPGEWQTYDIIFNRPVLKAVEGKDPEVIRPAYVTVIQNGVLVINHHEIEGITFYDQPPAYKWHDERVPISLQDHGNPLKFRNIWVREIPDDNTKPKQTKKPYYL